MVYCGTIITIIAVYRLLCICTQFREKDCWMKFFFFLNKIYEEHQGNKTFSNTADDHLRELQFKLQSLIPRAHFSRNVKVFNISFDFVKDIVFVAKHFWSCRILREELRSFRVIWKSYYTRVIFMVEWYKKRRILSKESEILEYSRKCWTLESLMRTIIKGKYRLYDNTPINQFFTLLSENWK